MPKPNLFRWPKLLRGSKDDDAFSRLEEQLVRADVGIDNAKSIVEAVRACAKGRSVKDPSDFRAVVEDTLLGLFDVPSVDLSAGDERPIVLLLVGVNGAGKTTCIAKLGRHYQNLGRSVLFGAGDTYRAAAFEQLNTWGERLGIPVVGSKQSTDGASVLYDSIESALKKGIDYCLVDTAGRLENKAPLMDQLRKVRRITDKFEGRVTSRTLLVLDATLGISGYKQADVFTNTIPIDGLFLTKVDSHSKGGIILAVAKDFQLPICFLGHGESPEDMSVFDPKEYVDSLL